jgi:hypothetical protein
VAWAGSCKLRNLQKIEDRSLPIPYVVYEAIYTPDKNPNFPSYTPPEIRLHFGARAQYELALTDHLQRQSSVECHLPVVSGACPSEVLVASVVPFDSEGAAAPTAPTAVGCAAIESASSQDSVRQARSGSATIPERFTFSNGSAALAAEDSAAAQAVAERLKADPTIQCVGIVGQISYGEPVSLAEARARMVKEQLISLGVDGSRLLTIAATTSVFGPGAKPQDADTKTQSVSLKVLLQSPVSASAP